jgi:hypothetical protein
MTTRKPADLTYNRHWDVVMVITSIDTVGSETYDDIRDQVADLMFVVTGPTADLEPHRALKTATAQESP